jgi:hypothetical protein
MHRLRSCPPIATPLLHDMMWRDYVLCVHRTYMHRADPVMWMLQLLLTRCRLQNSRRRPIERLLVHNFAPVAANPLKGTEAPRIDICHRQTAAVILVQLGKSCPTCDLLMDKYQRIIIMNRVSWFFFVSHPAQRLGIGSG